MGERCPGAESLGCAVLAGWQLRFDRPSRRWGGYVADVVQQEGAETFGVLWRVNADHLASLDYFEGVATGAYRRDTVSLTVTHETGAAIRAEVYVVCDAVEPGPPSAQYLGVMVEGAKEHHLPDHYVQLLQAFGPP